MIHVYKHYKNFLGILKRNDKKNAANWGAILPKLSTDLKTAVWWLYN